MSRKAEGRRREDGRGRPRRRAGEMVRAWGQMEREVGLKGGRSHSAQRAGREYKKEDGR